ncbi:hypothetical protein HYC85_026564 [Camellia sinensis]|uniref:Uncharacterized protein n=1 Tax=Camellia sinensis TaxID=4442 RepID=A0A7J7G562_CAMSI|nr:hypothetical protein HYC85_026564 [Camellia sinensis]
MVGETEAMRSHDLRSVAKERLNLAVSDLKNLPLIYSYNSIQSLTKNINKSDTEHDLVIAVNFIYSIIFGAKYSCQYDTGAGVGSMLDSPPLSRTRLIKKDEEGIVGLDLSNFRSYSLCLDLLSLDLAVRVCEKRREDCLRDLLMNPDTTNTLLDSFTRVPCNIDPKHRGYDSKLSSNLRHRAEPEGMNMQKQMPSLRIIYTRADLGSGWGRIIHTPIRRGKRVEMDVCRATTLRILRFIIKPDDLLGRFVVLLIPFCNCYHYIVLCFLILQIEVIQRKFDRPKMNSMILMLIVNLFWIYALKIKMG